MLKESWNKELYSCILYTRYELSGLENRKLTLFQNFGDRKFIQRFMPFSKEENIELNQVPQHHFTSTLEMTW